MDQETIAIWIEPNYAETPWCHKLFDGIKAELTRRRCKALINTSEEPTEGIVQNGIVIIAGETNGWIERMISIAHASNMRICVACADPETVLPNASTVTLDRWGDMCTMIRYFCDAGRRRIALFGVNPASPADQKRIEGYQDMVKSLQLDLSQEDIYPTYGDVQACSAKLLFHIGRYDAIIAGNDLYAIYLMPLLIKAGYSIPDQLYIAGFGNTYLSRCVSPSLTTAALDHAELGRQAIHSAFHLEKNPQVSRLSTTVEGRFFPRASTAFRPVTTGSATRATSRIRSEISSYTDCHLSQVVNLEMCLAGCDAMDLAIVEELKKVQSVNAIADKLYLSQSSLNYRLNKLYHQASVASRQEFEKLLNLYAANFTVDAVRSAGEIKL